MAKQIYFVMSCDEWKNYDSARLIWLGTSQQKLKMFISQKIEEQTMEYGNTENSPEKQAEQFRKDWKTKPSTEINSLLQYAFYDYGYDNEEV